MKILAAALLALVTVSVSLNAPKAGDAESSIRATLNAQCDAGTRAISGLHEGICENRQASLCQRQHGSAGLGQDA